MKNITPKLVLLLSISGLLLFGVWLTLSSGNKNANPQTVQRSAEQDRISYRGQQGKNALELLQQQATVKQDASGLVIAINTRKAEPSKREYWAFYVNGKMAQVGPKEYVTQETDRIEWKIENY